MNNENEVALLGAAILDPSTIDVVSGSLSPADFQNKAFGQAFALMIDMHAADKPVDDHALLVTHLRDAGLLDPMGGIAGVAGLAVGCPNVHRASHYAAEIKSASVRRRLRSLADDLASRADDPKAKPDEILDWLDGSITRQRSGGHGGVQTLACAMQAAIDDILDARSKKRVSGLSTGLPILDGALGALYQSDLVILAARPSIGKSALGVQIGLHVAGLGRQVLFVSLEMTGRDIATRRLAAAMNYEVRTLRAGFVSDVDICEMQEHQQTFASVPFHIWNGRGATMSKIRGVAKVQRATSGLDLLVVDYLGLVQASDKRKPRWEAITEISGELKSLAMELQIPILCLCQLNREAEKGKPNLGHLRDAGAIEQDADVVMLLHRESRDSSNATIDVAKARNGATGEVELFFDAGATQFSDVPKVVDAYATFAN